MINQTDKEKYKDKLTGHKNDKQKDNDKYDRRRKYNDK